MQTVTTLVSRDADACWHMFTDVAQLTSWVPGLRSAEILTIERGLPAEIHFEYGAFAYTLVYSYDRANHEVRWQPKLGKQGGVTGFARFEPEGNGTRVTYGSEPGESRTAEDLQPIVEAFAARMHTT
jgi:carbon monoxide dehydrogenase subunit G